MSIQSACESVDRKYIGGKEGINEKSYCTATTGTRVE